MLTTNTNYSLTIDDISQNWLHLTVRHDFNEVIPTFVKIANTEFPVVVEDGNYSEELIYSTVKDISLVFSQKNIILEKLQITKVFR